MGFGRNPYVPKALLAEQKANDADDDATRARAHRDAAHQWDRAAEREPPGKRRVEYEQNAARNRAIADGDAPAPSEDENDAEDNSAPPANPRLLN
jgi:phage repressor protein C with HTH and peptisase S24 domain